MSTAPDDGSDVLAQRVGGPRSELRHGRWTLQLRGDEVADIAYDGVLLLRAVRPVVRDRDWNTLPARVLAPVSGSGAEVNVELRFQQTGIDYAVTLTVRLSADELVVDFDGRAETAFDRNRIGLVVLHPASDAGAAVTVNHTDGTVTRGRWPMAISPHQPFTDVAGFAWTRDGVTAELTLSGDTFETEDQRNWTDASFKTYSTPLDRPFPVPVAVGDRVQQQARLRVVDDAPASRSRIQHTDAVRVGSTVVTRLPTLSVGAALYPPPAAPPALGPGYDSVLVELTEPEDRWPELLGTAVRQAAALEAHLDVRLVTADPSALGRGVGLLQDLPVRRLAAFDPASHLTTPALWAVLRDVAGRLGFGGELVGGTRAHFTELNRGQSSLPDDLPALTFSLTPTMHATELPHLLDSLATQRTVADNAVRIAAGRPVHVGPVTLARRFNAVATSGRPDPATEARRAVDPLQHTAFAAAWTLGSVGALSVPGVTGLTYFETAGDRGLANSGDGGGRGGEGAGLSGLSPAGRLLGVLAGATGRPVLDVEAPSDLAALPLATSGPEVELLLANLSGRDRQVVVLSDHRPPVSLPLAGWALTRVQLG